MKRGLLATERELTGLRDRVGRKPFDHIYDTLRKRCALILESQPITETMWRSAHQQGRWGAATAAVASLQGRIFDLLVCHRVDPNSAYRDRALEELKNLVGFSTWVDPSHNDLSADLCTGEACATVAVALDWLAEELTEADRLRCVRVLREKGLQPYLAAVKAGAFWQSCYHNWNAVVNGGVGLAALLLSDEEDAAEAALAKAKAGLENFFNALGREGGWDEGLGYWGYAMRYLLLFGEGLSRASGDSHVFHQRGMDATGLFPIYFSPHGLAVSFGDMPLAPAWGVFYLLVKHFGIKEVAWWLDRYGFRHGLVTSGYSDAGLALLFRPLDWEHQPAPDLHPVKVFNEIGWAAVADRWPAPNLYAALKSGDLSAHHAQLDMNSVQIVCDGEILLHDPGSPEYSREYLSPEGRYDFYEVQSRAHNTVTLGDRGHRIDAVGSIVEAQDAPAYRWVAADGGAALGEDVHFVRHLVMPVVEPTRAGRMIVVLDEIHNVVPEPIQASWHTAGGVDLKRRLKSGVIAGGSSSLHFALAASCAFKLSSGRHALSKRRDDRSVVVSTPAVSQAVIAAVFAAEPLGKPQLKRSARGDVTLRAGVLQLHWRASPGYLQLDSIKELS